MKKQILTLISLTILTACNLPATPTPSPVLPTATPIPPTATSLPPTFTLSSPTNTPTPLPPTPTAALTPLAVQSDVYLIVQSNGFLLGGVQAGNWLSPAQASLSAPAATQYRFYDLQIQRVEASGSQPLVSEYPPCAGAFETRLEPPVGSFSWVGISSPWDPAPRAAEPLAFLSTAESAALESLLVQNGTTQASYQQVTAYRVDLEGDGSLETIITATALQEESLHMVSPGEYSLAAILFSQPDGSSLAVPLVADYYAAEDELGFPSAYAVSAILDLNGDGQMEVIIHDRHWEGNLLLVFEINANTMQRVLDTCCMEEAIGDERCLNGKP